MEFITTYGLTLLVIAIALGLLLLYVNIPATTLPLQCTFYGGFNCLDGAYYNSNTPSNSQLLIIASNMEPGIVNFSNFSATINNKQSNSGYCRHVISASNMIYVGNTAYAGNTVICIANFSTGAVIGNSYTASFHISSNYCTAGPSAVSNSVCASSFAYSYAGEARFQATQIK
ncbi:MAG: hypothetical protein ABSA33_00905 [Candidatus Micrarchaeaceae archaeon]